MSLHLILSFIRRLLKEFLVFHYDIPIIQKIAVVGFSAGAHLAACLATQWHEPFVSEYLGVSPEEIRPNAAILCYPLTNYVKQLECLEKDVDKDILSVSMDIPKPIVNDILVKISVGEDATEKQLEEVSPYAIALSLMFMSPNTGETGKAIYAAVTY